MDVRNKTDLQVKEKPCVTNQLCYWEQPLWFHAYLSWKLFFRTALEPVSHFLWICRLKGVKGQFLPDFTAKRASCSRGILLREEKSETKNAQAVVVYLWLSAKMIRTPRFNFEQFICYKHILSNCSHFRMHQGKYFIEMKSQRRKKWIQNDFFDSNKP